MNSFANYLLSEAHSGGISIMSLEKFVSSQDHEIKEDENEEPFLGAKHRIPTDAEMQDYLSRIMSGDKTKREKYVMPYIHNKLLVQIQGPSFVLDKNGENCLDTASGKLIDVEKLKKEITVRPKEILSQNEKMAKSGGIQYEFFNFGVPALTGLAVDEKTNKFIIVNTCPGAGQCKLFCYALKGGYVQYPAVFVKQTRMLNYLLNDPKSFFDQLEIEIGNKVTKYNKKGIQLAIRWHDAGDFFSERYKKLFFELVKKFPNVIFYAYTKLSSIASGSAPDNFIANFSSGALPSQEKSVDLKKQKHSVVVPKDLFVDLTEHGEGKLLFKSKESEKEFKQRLAKKYNVDFDSILTYEEMNNTPKANGTYQWNVIVKKGDGDVSATRSDVLITFLLIH